MDLTRLYTTLKGEESCRLVAYQDQNQVWTIGYGHTSGVKKGDTCTQTQADDWLVNDVNTAINQLDAHISWWRKIPGDPRQNVLIDMCFNEGIGRLLAFKKMLAALLEGNYEEAANQMANSLWAKQVPHREKPLEDLMRSGQF